MKKFALWFAAFMCAGLTLAGISSFFRDLSANPGSAFQELIIARKIEPNAPLPVVKAPSLILSHGEICHLAENVKVGKTKTVTTRTVTSHSGGSVRIAKGLSIRRGTSVSRPIRKNVLDTVFGTLYVTNRRIVVSSQKYNFDKPLSALSSYTMYIDGFSLQFGKESFTFLVRDRVYIMTILLALTSSCG